MVVNITKLPRPHISEEKTATTLGSNATKNVRIPVKENFRGCRHCDFTGDLKKSGASQVVLVVKNLPANAGDTGDAGLIPGSERSLEAGNDYPLQYSCLENSIDRGTWWVTVHGAAESDTNKWLSCSSSLMDSGEIFHSTKPPFLLTV